ncbi:putative lyase [Labilithrix luteola]|uniref:Putative lyase n=1 Tax=Labilithrix luteola TaxID=1391654 RepID=A0A0K1PM07_9BACT|nr:VOC family protein [Labilithrix luteola]AKU94557.1 putative lyase [Labilithrix luteola]
MTTETLDYFRPETGAVLTHLLIVRDVDRSREFYRNVLGATVIRERSPAILQFQNSYIVINNGGGPTDDKPDVQAAAPADSKTLSSAMNIRVNDVQATYDLWRSRGGEFLTPPKNHALEIRCYLRDPDGYLIEVGQATGILDQLSGARPH